MPDMKGHDFRALRDEVFEIALLVDLVLWFCAGSICDIAAFEGDSLPSALSRERYEHILNTSRPERNCTS